MAGAFLDRGQRLSVGREVGIEQARLRRQPADASGCACQRVQIAVQRDIAPDFLLVEIQLVAADRRRRSEISGRELSRPGSGPAGVERQTVQRRKSVRRLHRIDDLSGASLARKAIEARTADDESVVRQPGRAAVGGGRRRAVDQRALVILPERAERFAIDAFEDGRGRKRHAPRSRVGEIGQRRGAEAVGEVLMKTKPVCVRGVAARPVGEAAVHPVERLQGTSTRGFAENGGEIAGVHAPLAGEGAFLVRRDAFDLPDRKIQVRKRDRRAAKNVPEHPGKTFGSIEVHDMGELVREHEVQPIVDVADEFVSGRPGGRDDDGIVRHRRGGSVGKLGLIDEHDVRSCRRRDPEPFAERRPGLFRNSGEPARERFSALVEMDGEMVRADRAKPQRRIEKARRVDRHGGDKKECRQKAAAHEPGWHRRF